MGNNLIKEYKDNYIQGNYKIVKKFNNNLFGTYYLIYFLKPKSQYFFMKTIDPNKYNNYSCDIDLFIEKIKNQHKNLNNFIFWTTNKYNEEIFDIIFEYNPTLFDLLILQKKDIFKTEKEIWLLIEDVMECFIFMQEKKEHLIEINLNSISLKDGKDFSVMNPYLFENYFNEVLGIYLNKNLDNILYNKKNINKNWIEFGCLILQLILKDYKIQININNCLIYLEKIKYKISKKLFDLIYLIFNKEQKFLFSDIKKYLINGSQKGDIFEKILSKKIPPPPNTRPIQKIFDDKKDKINNTNSNKSGSSHSKNSEKDMFNLEKLNKKIDSNKKIIRFKSYENNTIEERNFNQTRRIVKGKSNENNDDYVFSDRMIKNYQSNIQEKYSKPSSLKNIPNNEIYEKAKNNENDKDYKFKLGFPEKKDKPSLINYNRNSGSNYRSDSLPNKLNKNIIINLLNPEGKLKKWYNYEDTFDNDKNNFLYQNISKIVNWNSNLKESVYHNVKKLYAKNSFVIN